MKILIPNYRLTSGFEGITSVHRARRTGPNCPKCYEPIQPNTTYVKHHEKGQSARRYHVPCAEWKGLLERIAPPARICLDRTNCGSFIGALAQPYAYKVELRARLDEIRAAALASTNRYFVLEGTTLRAAQTTLDGAMAYMTPDCILVSVEL